MSFEKWLLKQSDRDDPIGDLAKDWPRDPSTPDRIDGPLTLTNYLQRKGAHHSAIEAGRLAWHEYASRVS